MTKKIYLTLLSVFLSLFCTYAQVSQTVTVSQPGTLSQSLGDNKTKVTDLILLGTINAQDFQTIKQMSALKNLDMAGVKIDNNTIPNNAFQGRVMNKIILPEGLKKVGNSSFRSVSLKSDLVLPSTVEIIDDAAFYDMVTKVDFSKTKNSLKSVGFTFVANYTVDPVLDFSDFKFLKEFATYNVYGTFLGYTGHVILPRNLEVLPNSTFSNFEGTVTLPEGLKRIGESSFRSASLKSALILPSTLEVIDANAFHTMKTKIDFSKTKNSLKSVGFAFVDNYTVDSVLDFSDFKFLKEFGIYNGYGTFLGYTGHVILPNNLEVLPHNSFAYFQGTVSLPEGLKKIGDSSFRSASLKSALILPSTLEVIDANAFHTMKTKIDFSKTKNSLKSVGFAFVDNYTVDSVLDFSNFKFLKEFGIYNGYGTFLGYRGHVILPNNLEVLPHNSFAYFQGTVSLPEGLKKIGDSSFRSASLPSALVLPSTVEVIDANAFHAMKSKIDFSKTKNSLKSVGFAFVDNYTVDSVLDFSEFKLLKEFTTYNGYGTFLGYRGHVILPNNLEVLPNNSFAYFGGTVTLPQALKTIGARAFDNSTIKRIDLPGSVTFIGTNAFLRCSQLEQILSRNTTPPALGLDVFAGIDKVRTKLFVPENSISLYGKADQWKDFLILGESEANIPSIIKLHYTEDAGKTNQEYDGVRIGEYYWMNRPFQGNDMGAKVQSDDWGVAEIREWLSVYNRMISRKSIDLSHRRAFLFENAESKYDRYYYLDQILPGAPEEVKVAEFKKYYGDYLTRRHIEWMSSFPERVGLVEGSFNEGKRWALPSESDVRQLVAMCGYGSVKEVRQFLSYGFDQEDAPSVAKVVPTGNFDWFNPTNNSFVYANMKSETDTTTVHINNGYNPSNTNKYKFNMYPSGSMANGSISYFPFTCRKDTLYALATVNEDVPYKVVQGDFIGLNHTFSLPTANESTFVLHDYPEIKKEKSYHWQTVRYSRALTDEELGYKLYINHPGFTDTQYSLKQLLNRIQSGDKIVIERKSLTESPSAGFVDLPRGFLRGFYVQFILGKSVPDKTIEELVKVALYNPYIWAGVSRASAPLLNSCGEPIATETKTKAIVDTQIMSDTQNLVIYPNPVVDVLNISGGEVEKVLIYDLSGRQVAKSVKSNAISVRDLTRGSYIVKVTTSAGESTHKIMKQ